MPATDPRSSSAHGRRAALRLLGAGAAIALPAGLRAQGVPLRVAVAASSAAFVRDWASVLGQHHGLRLSTAIGSTGALYAQLRQGAPFHVLLAADGSTPQRLVSEGLAQAESVVTYAVGRLVLWGAQPEAVDPEGQVLRRWAAGQAPGGRLALANPKLAPYGAAALQTLERLGFLEALRPRLVFGESVAQAHQFVASGNAALGLLARSVTLPSPGAAKGSSWLVPAPLHDPLRHDACVLRAPTPHPDTERFMRLLRHADTQARLRRFGYEIAA